MAEEESTLNLTILEQILSKMFTDIEKQGIIDTNRLQQIRLLFESSEIVNIEQVIDALTLKSEGIE